MTNVATTRRGHGGKSGSGNESNSKSMSRSPSHVLITPHRSLKEAKTKSYKANFRVISRSGAKTVALDESNSVSLPHNKIGSYNPTPQVNISPVDGQKELQKYIK